MSTQVLTLLVAIAGLIISIAGWLRPYYFQSKTLTRLKKAEQEIKRLEQNSLDDFHKFLLFKKPFIEPQLFAEFTAIEELFERSLGGIVFARRNYDKSAEGHFVTEFMSQAQTLMDKIEEMIKEQINKKFPVT